MRLFWKIIPWSGTAKRYGSQAMITSGPVLRPPPLPHPSLTPPVHAATSNDTQTQACRQTHAHAHTRMHTQTHTHIIMRTCWPVLLRRGEMLSNSAFQHSTSDYLFSFTGRFELVMYFPFSVGLASLFLSLSLSLCLSRALSLPCTLGIPRSPVHEIHSDRNLEVRPFPYE